MASKKQKRAAAMAKREEYMAKVKAEGLAAQKRDRERRTQATMAVRVITDEVNDQRRQILAKHDIHEGDTLAERMGVDEPDKTIRPRQFVALLRKF